jgi:hypothetical protein
MKLIRILSYVLAALAGLYLLAVVLYAIRPFRYQSKPGPR